MFVVVVYIFIFRFSRRRMVLDREVLQGLSKEKLIDVVTKLTTVEYLDKQIAYENEMLVELLLSSSSSISSSTSLHHQLTPAALLPQQQTTNSNGSSNMEQTTNLVTLNQELLDQFKEIDATKYDLNRQTKRVTSSSIGMQSQLPQVIRRELKKRKIEDPKKSEEINQSVIVEESKTDLDIVREIDKLKGCCSRSNGNPNCIMMHFTVAKSGGSSAPGVDLTALCSFVRR